MKKIFSVLFILFGLSAQAQYLAPLDNKSGGAKSVGLLVSDSMHNQRYFDTATCKLSFWDKQANRLGRIARQDGRLYIYNGTKFALLDSVTGGSDTSELNLTTRFAEKVYTQTFLDSLTAARNRNVKFVDTAGMLANYQRSATAVKYGDTAAIVAGYLRKGDTASMLASYAKQRSVVDTASALRTAIDLKAPISTTVTLTGTQTVTNKTLSAPKVSSISAGTTNDSLLMWNPSTGNVEYLNPRTVASMVSRVIVSNYDTFYQYYTGARWKTIDSIDGFPPPPSTIFYEHSDWTSSVFANYTATSGAPSYTGSAPYRMLDVDATSATQTFYENASGLSNLRAYTRTLTFSVQTTNSGAVLTMTPLSFVLLQGYTTIFYLDGADKGKMRTYDPSGGGAYTAALSFAIGDTIELTEQELFGTRLMKAVRIDDGVRADSVSATLEDLIDVTMFGTGIFTQTSTYKHSFGLSAARIFIIQDKVESRMTYMADVLIIGDSYATGAFGSVGSTPTYANSWTRQWQAAEPSLEIEFYAGGGVPTSQYATGGSLTSQGTFLAGWAAKKVVIMMGTNDQAQGVSTATYIANLQTLINGLTAGGADSIFVCRMPPNDLYDVTSYNAAQSGLTGVDVFIDTYTPFKDAVSTDLDATYSAGDNVPHLNKAGQDLMFSTISAVVTP